MDNHPYPSDPDEMFLQQFLQDLRGAEPPVRFENVDTDTDLEEYEWRKLVNSNGWQELERKMVEAINTINRLWPATKDHAEVMKLAGRKEALEMVLGLPYSILGKYKQANAQGDE